MATPPSAVQPAMTWEFSLANEFVTFPKNLPPLLRRDITSHKEKVSRSDVLRGNCHAGVGPAAEEVEKKLVPGIAEVVRPLSFSENR